MTGSNHATAIVYARVSTAKQAEEQLPVEGQIEQCEAKAAALRAQVKRVFRDDGVSGAAESRPAFEAALDYACSQEIDYFIVWSSSRFGRDRLRAAGAKRELSRAGVQLVYCTMDVDTETTGGWMLDSMLEIFDEMQSRQVATDTRRSMERNARQGYFTGGNRPFGYRVVPAADEPKRRRLEVDPLEAPLVELIFERAQEAGAVAIAAELNSRGYRYRGGKRWTKSGVLGVLHSHAVIGQTVFNRKDRRTGRRRPRDEWIIVDSHEPIISREQWEAVHSRMEAATDVTQTGSPKSTHVFTGLLRCDECGALLQAESAKGRSRRYWYYNCRSAAVEKAHPPRRLPADELDAWLIDLICSEVFTYENLEGTIRELRSAIHNWEQEQSERRRQRVAALREIERKLGNLYDLLEEHGRGAPNLGDLTRRLREHQARRQELEREIAAIDAEDPPQVTVTDEEVGVLAETLRQTIREASPERARNFFREFVQRIVIEADQVRIEYRPERLVTVPSTSEWLPGADIRGTTVSEFPLASRFQRAA